MIIKIAVNLYGIIIILSIFISAFYIAKSLKKEGYKDRNIYLYFMMYISFALVFGKIFTLVTNQSAANLLTAGLSAYGGLIGVILAAIIFEKILPMNNEIIKYTIISLPLTYALTKIACFITGCCGGIPYEGFLYVIYPQGLNIPQFPIQIIETIVFLVVFLVCHKLRKNKNVLYITIIAGAIIKFLLDFLRYDHITKIITINQIFSVLLVLITIMVLIYQNITKKQKI